MRLNLKNIKNKSHKINFKKFPFESVFNPCSEKMSFWLKDFIQKSLLDEVTI